MLKINRVSLAENGPEISAISDKGDILKFDMLKEDIPMFIQMLLAAKQQIEKKEREAGKHDPSLLLNFVEGWEAFELPEAENIPKGIGLRFQCFGGFDFSFAITEDGGHTPAEFRNDLNSLFSGYLERMP
ncbi:MAG: hypothetical protein LBD73_03420 [Deferribacteraceae bacterium]|jgi:hypothetical protein|nr:hypothetical protein [Deferribacteraceae bacterium]